MMGMENIRMALASLKANKSRALLTMLGIIIGIAAVIAIMTVGNSVTNTVSSSMQSMGVNNVNIMVQSREQEAEERDKKRRKEERERIQREKQEAALRAEKEAAEKAEQERLAAIAAEAGYRCEVYKDYTGNDRVAYLTRPQKSEPESKPEGANT